MPVFTVVPDQIEPIVACRMWMYEIDECGLRIGAVSGDDTTWPGAERGRWVVASCSRWPETHHAPKFPHRVPNEYCTCGFYAMRTIDVAEEIIMIVRSYHRMGSPRAGAGPSDLAEFGSVFGRVELAGKVIEHRLGYRAERARVLELIPLGEDDGTTGAVARLLGVPTADALDVSTVDRLLDRIDESRVPEVGWRRQPTFVERMRLRKHRRHFRVIQGGAGSDDTTGWSTPG